jgi:CDP-glucose 4,6-dehydratase
MKTLITGASGFLGSTLINDYHEYLGDIVAISKSFQYVIDGKGYALDVCSPELIDIVQENSPSAIIHTAARSIVRDCEQNPSAAFAVNVQGTVNVLEAARKTGLDIPVVVLETDKVYGQQPAENIPTSEEHPLLGYTPYEYSKVLTAQVCDFYRTYYGMKIFSLRPANLYGYWDTNKSRIVPNTFSKLLAGISPVVYSDSKDQLREYVYVDDVCKIIAGLIRKDVKPGAYNISSGVVKSPEQVINLVRKTTNIQIETTLIEKPFNFEEIDSQALNGEKLNSLLGPEFVYTPMEDALDKMWSEIKLRGYGF